MNLFNNIFCPTTSEKVMVSKETQTDESFLMDYYEKSKNINMDNQFTFVYEDFYSDLKDYYTSNDELVEDINNFKNYIFNTH